jgi:hypothetical protein
LTAAMAPYATTDSVGISMGGRGSKVLTVW